METQSDLIDNRENVSANTPDKIARDAAPFERQPEPAEILAEHDQRRSLFIHLGLLPRMRRLFK